MTFYELFKDLRFYNPAVNPYGITVNAGTIVVRYVEGGELWLPDSDWFHPFNFEFEPWEARVISPLEMLAKQAGD